MSTERYLFNCHGTFYELPTENAGGFAKIRPISSHKRLIADFASYRGLFVITGIETGTKSPHIIRSDDGKVAVWAGAIDDLWKLGKPTGTGFQPFLFAAGGTGDSGGTRSPGPEALFQTDAIRSGRVFMPLETSLEKRNHRKLHLQSPKRLR